MSSLSVNCSVSVCDSMLSLSDNFRGFKKKYTSYGLTICIFLLGKHFAVSHSLSFTITGGAARHEKVKPKTWRILTSIDAITMTTDSFLLMVITTDPALFWARCSFHTPLVFAKILYQQRVYHWPIAAGSSENIRSFWMFERFFYAFPYW